ncbi:MAG TPA: sigma-70 family RNA polymerase sigma factor [Verrucomicrobiae bacterium]|nr:sigma-70 family RNA polymerase sigma factor [Verrucomicrobiae bacterium]
MNHLGNSSDAAMNPAGTVGKEGKASPSDAELVQACCRGDKRAFVEIVVRHQAMVCGIALGILGDFAASEDAGQEAFLTAWRKIHELREPERLRAWLGQIARHAALGHLRRTRGHDAVDLEQAPDVADDAPAPDAVAANEEEVALVRESLAKLPETYRLPLVLFYREHQSVRAVAEALGVSEDAVKQRLARGREMLRERMSGLIENVLGRTGPTPIFTMAIAAAIGALAAPAAVAGGVFTAAAAAGTTTSASTPLASLFTTMSALKTLVITAVVTVVCIPVGFYLRSDPESVARSSEGTLPASAQQKIAGDFETSAIFAEWKQLHDTYGTTSEAMPEIYQAIAGLKDPFRRRAFRAALVAEWVQVDPTNGLVFFLDKRGDAAQRGQFFDEWLARDARAAVNTLLESGMGWEGAARDALAEIARRVPARVPEIVSRLPKTDNYWDTSVREAFAIVAGGGLAAARAAAEAIQGPNREQALSGVAQEWAKSELEAAINWIKGLPEGTDREEIIRAALVGKAATDPGAALEKVGMVPAGGRQGYYATTTGARVLRAAAAADFDSTVSWLAGHPGRFESEDMMGLVSAIGERLNADAAGFLTQYASAGYLSVMTPAIANALLNDASGQRAAIWDWLKAQPTDETIQSIQNNVLSSASYQDSALALRLVADLPPTAEGDAQVKSMANSLLNNGSVVPRLDKLLEQAPERLRQPLIESAFEHLRPDTLEDPRTWVARLPLLPETARARGIQAIVGAWAERSPEETGAWVSTLPPGESRDTALGSVTSAWATKDPAAASAWVNSLSAGTDRDRGAQALAFAFADNRPQEAWDWAVSIRDEERRMVAAKRAVLAVAPRDPTMAQQWIESSALDQETKAKLQSALELATRTSKLR